MLLLNKEESLVDSVFCENLANYVSYLPYNKIAVHIKRILNNKLVKFSEYYVIVT